MIRRFLLLVALSVAGSPLSANALDRESQTVSPVASARDRIRTDTPSGLPVPRFVSLKTVKTNCRSGPSFSHPIRFVFVRRGLPVQIIAETTDYWRKVRDADGDECWIHRSKLSGTSMALVVRDGVALRAGPFSTAHPRAHLGLGLIARVHREQGGWLQVSAGGAKGWAIRDGFWGGTP